MRALVVLLLVTSVGLAGCLGDVPAAGPSNTSTDGATGEQPDAAGANRSEAGEAADGNASRWANGTEVDSGQIAAGSPTTYFCSLTVCAGQEGVESFRMEEVPPPGVVIGTNTTDNGGAGFNLDLYFHDANGTYLGGCSDRPGVGQAGEQTCEVPDDAASGTVDAAWGVDLDVVVIVVDASADA